MATTPEGKVKKLVKDALLREFGTEAYRFMPVQSGFGAVSLDFLCCIRGRFVAIETKAPGNRMTPLQKTTSRAIEDAGGLVYVVHDQPSCDHMVASIKLAQEFDEKWRSPILTSPALPPR